MPDLRPSRSPDRILLGPGPSLVPPPVQAALSRPLVGHMDPGLFTVLDDVVASLRQVFQTTNEVTFPVSGTGTAGMEACIVNAVEPGDRVVVASGGYFAQRIAEVAARAGAEVTLVEAPWGQAVDPADVERALNGRKTKLLAAVQVETSTGVLQPIEHLVRVGHQYDTLVLIDAVASLGGVDLPADRWGIDLCYSGSQKCLSAPPGMAPLTVSDRVRRLPRTRRVQSFYLDLELLWQYWGSARTYHHTVPVPLIYAMQEALRLILLEGLPARFARHARNAAALYSGLEALGLRLFVPAGVQSPTVITVEVPQGVDDARVRRRLLEEYEIEIAGGLGPLRGRIWRIGLMGHSSQPRYVLMLLSALDALLGEEGFRLERGAGVTAATGALGPLHG